MVSVGVVLVWGGGERWDGEVGVGDEGWDGDGGVG